jgi:hypothetical protein
LLRETRFPVLFSFQSYNKCSLLGGVKGERSPILIAYSGAMYIEVPAEQPHNGVVEPSPLVYITPTYVSWDIMCTRLDDVLHGVFTTCLFVH